LNILFLDNTSIKRSFIFSFEAALCDVVSYELIGIGANRAAGMSAKVSFAAAVFYLFMYFCMAVINLLPATIIRSTIVREPMEGSSAVGSSFICYAPVRLLAVIPYKIFFTNTMPIGSIWVIMGLVAELGWAFLSIAANYTIITMPPISKSSLEELTVPLNDSDKCMTALGDFMTLLHKQLGERRKMEKLWSPAYTYLKDLPKIQNLVRGQKLHYDEIVLNAVGSIAFKLLASGELHSSFGVLSPDGEYVRKVWWVTANELVNRSYNKPEDVTQGLQLLDSKIISVGPRE
jgi:hypothetical protein